MPFKTFKSSLKSLRKPLRMSKQANPMPPRKSSIQAVVKQQIQSNAEKKEFYSSGAAVNVTTSGSVIPLNNFAEGDEFNQRNGRIIKTTYIDVLYSTYATGINSSTDGHTVALVWDKAGNTTTPSLSDIFLTGSAGNPSLAFKNTPANAERFHIAWIDYLPAADESLQTASNNMFSRKRQFYRCPDKYANTRFLNTTAAVPTLGAWFLVFFDASNVAATTTIDYTVKYCYTDI